MSKVHFLLWVIVAPLAAMFALSCPVCVTKDGNLHWQPRGIGYLNVFQGFGFRSAVIDELKPESPVHVDPSHVAARKAAMEAARAAASQAVDQTSDPIKILQTLPNMSGLHRAQSLINGYDIKSVDSNGQNGLHAVLRQQQFEPEVVRQLVNLGVDIEFRDQWGVTPLMLASADPSPATLLAMIDRASALEMKDRDGSTALMFAALAGRTENVRRLLERGARADAQQNDGATAHSLALQQGFSEIVTLLNAKR